MSRLSKALYAGIICDDIELTDGYDFKRKPITSEMTENPLYDLAYKTRCFQWFHITTPTDENLVPDNILTNECRL
eukprot:3141088-Heterocapsa_arctica.AAC.1